jgi:SMI1 / KNR4 family (SUKH-1)
MIDNSRMKQLEPLSPPADQKAIKAFEMLRGIKLPRDYVRFLARTNGAEGNISDQSYIVIWPIEDVAKLNKAYKFDEWLPWLTCIGSDGGGTAYCFDYRTAKIQVVAIEFTNMSEEDVVLCAESFTDFMNRL